MKSLVQAAEGAKAGAEPPQIRTCLRCIEVLITISSAGIPGRELSEHLESTSCMLRDSSFPSVPPRTPEDVSGWLRVHPTPRQVPACLCSEQVPSGGHLREPGFAPPCSPGGISRGKPSDADVSTLSLGFLLFTDPADPGVFKGRSLER